MASNLFLINIGLVHVFVFDSRRLSQVSVGNLSRGLINVGDN